MLTFLYTTLVAAGLTSITFAATRNERPKFPTDPRTTAFCSWWLDNDGFRRCSDVPLDWGVVGSLPFWAWCPPTPWAL